MNNRASVEILESLGELIDDEPDVDLLEDAFGDDIMKICLHELKDQIHIFIIVCLDGFVELDNVGVVGLPQNLDFPISPLGVSGVLKGVEYFFEGIDLFGGTIFDFPDVTVSPRSHLLQNVVTPQNMVFNMAGLVLIHFNIYNYSYPYRCRQ